MNEANFRTTKEVNVTINGKVEEIFVEHSVTSIKDFEAIEDEDIPAIKHVDVTVNEGIVVLDDIKNEKVYYLDNLENTKLGTKDPIPDLGIDVDTKVEI